MTQKQKIRDYTASSEYFVDTKSLWNLAWHDSFVRNGLSDFVPPLTDNLNVLVVGGISDSPGGDAASSSTSAGREEMGNTEPTTTSGTTTTQIVAAERNEENTDLAYIQDSSCSFLTAIFNDDYNNDDNTKNGDGNDGTLEIPSYDCIMDQGLLADILARGDHALRDDRGIAADEHTNKSREEMSRLLFEATKRIREMGIFVTQTPGPLSDETKEYLTKVGDMLGLQWVFALDGISDETQSVNVARYSQWMRDELPPGWQAFRKMGLHD